MIEEYGPLGIALKNEIELAVEKRVSDAIEPIRVLKDFESVEVLTLDEVCKVLRFDSKEKIRDACKRGELPHVVVGRDIIFPKRLLVEYLMGTWRARTEEKERRPVRLSNVSSKISDFVS